MLSSYILSLFSEVISFISPRKNYVRIDFPYCAQWESPKLVDDIIKRKINATEDPRWRRSGAKNQKDYEYWTWNICGMACLKMILVYKKIKNYPLIILAKKCASYGGYIPRENEIEGLIYQPFCTFVRKEFGLEAKIAPFLSVSRIKAELSKGNFVMVSVNPNIRDVTNETPLHKNGHLVLVIGYDESKKCLFIHNPSGYYNQSQEHYTISENDFKRFFGKRGLVILNSTKKIRPWSAPRSDPYRTTSREILVS